MSSISAAEHWLSQTTGGHPALVPALVLSGIVLFLAVVLDVIVTSIIRPVQEKLGLRSRRRAIESVRSTTFAADPEGPTVIASPSGQFFLTLLPGRRSEHGESIQEPSGTAYKLQSDGQIRELWRVKGWHSFHECFLSDDGHFLVRTFDSAGDGDVEDLMMAFYDRGALLRQLSISDLVTPEPNRLGSISRSGGRGESETESSWPAFGLSVDNTLRMTTADRMSYVFDITTGEIIPDDFHLEPPDGLRLHKAMFVAGACVAVASIGALLAFSRRRVK